MGIEFRNAINRWEVSASGPPDELHVKPKNGAMRDQLRAAIGGQIKPKNPNYSKLGYNVLREEDGVFILTTAKEG